jgi:hypothetical protein
MLRFIIDGFISCTVVVVDRLLIAMQFLFAFFLQLWQKLQ